MSRAWLAFIATFCFIAAALAQAAAPTTHPGTKLNFPPTLGGATFMASFNHGSAVSYRYLAGKVQITVQIFDAGRRVPAVPGSPGPTLQFNGRNAGAQPPAR